MNAAMETKIFTIISCAGQARSLCFEALQKARSGLFDDAERCLEQAQDALAQTHSTHVGMIQQEAMGEKQALSLLLLHAEDHLMTTLLAKDLICELISILREGKGTFKAVQAI